MSTHIRVRDGIAHVSAGSISTGPISTGPAAATRAPFLTAIVEATGALLHWDPTAGAALPDADIGDATAASGWLAEVYGTTIAEAVLRGDDVSVTVAGSGAREPADPRIVDAVLRLGHLTWARAWWPASARLPALDPALLATEIARTSHDLTHLLDDDEAVERALHDAADAPGVLAALPPALAADGAALATALAELADDHGIALLAAASTREEWALAAGGPGAPASGIEIANGTAPVRWADVPAQSVDAEGVAHWALSQHAGAVTLRVEVPAVDTAFAARTLRARFGPAASGVDVALERDGSRFFGEAAVAASLAFLPADARTLWVRDPMLASAPGSPESAADRDRVRRFAALRLGSPAASLAERAAGAAR